MTDRFVPVPDKTMLLLGSKTGFEELAATVRLAAGVSRSPTVKARAGVAVFTGIV